MARLFFPTLLICLALSAAGCARPASDDYFPLDPGLHWVYEVHEQNPLTDEVRTLSVENRRPRTRNDRRYARRHASDGNEYWLARDADGIARYGVRTAIDFDPRMDLEHPRIVLRLPPQPGMWWEVDTRPFILERAEPFRERFAQDESKRILLRMQVASLDDRVEVPAGTYEHCLRIEGSGLLHVLADPRLGASEVPVNQTEWYAPGIGLVKLERTETLETQQIVGGTITMELLKFGS